MFDYYLSLCPIRGISSHQTIAGQNLPTPMNSFDLDSNASFRSIKNSLSMRIKRNLFRFVDWLPFLYIFAIVSGMASHER